MSLPFYDINEMVATHKGRPAKLLFALWEILAPNPHELAREEQTILDAWNFDSTFGNGIGDQLVNENYDVIARGLKALQELKVPRLSAFVHTVEGVFNRHGISSETGDDIAELEKLPIDERAQLMEELASAEASFLDEIWHQGLVHTSALSYIHENMAAFAQRKPA